MSATYDTDDYEPNTIDSDAFISEIPISLLKENIISQFRDPFENHKNDYISTFINKYEYSKEHIGDDDETLEELTIMRNDFMEFMSDTFRKYVDIGIPNFDDLPEDEQNDIVQYTYRFLIINITRNFKNLIMNYIAKYKKTLAEMSSKKKDVTTMSFKKEIDNQDDITILASLSEIIENILSEDIDVEQFLTLCGTDCLETNFVDNAYDEAMITGNFVPKYMNMVSSEFRTEIEGKVRNKILKRNKKKPVLKEV